MPRETDYLKGRAAIVTGAAGGIGEKICIALADMGINLAISGRNAEKLRALAERLEARGVQTRVCAGDLRALTFIQEILDTARQAFGGIDILINNAGIAQNSSFEEVSPELFDDIMATNVRAPYFLCRGALPELESSGIGTIINICSVVAHKGYPRQSVYAASKHALLGFSKSLANEVYTRNIRVHAISPGSVYTDMIALARPDLSPEGMALPEDIADIVCFLLEKRRSNACIDEVQLHRSTNAPFA